MLVYRVLPYRRVAKPGEPGHPLYVHPAQGAGRWDNPDLYRVLYAAASPAAAAGEAFGHVAPWTGAMLRFPSLAADRHLVAYAVDERRHPVLDFDDGQALVDRGLRPTDVVIRNRPRTQAVAAAAFAERRWSGLSWWSRHRPEWAVFAFWDTSGFEVASVERLPGHPALTEAADLLGRTLSADLRAARP